VFLVRVYYLLPTKFIADRIKILIVGHSNNTYQTSSHSFSRACRVARL
jgi:hypothetical protein